MATCTNKNREDVALSPIQKQLQAFIRKALALTGLDLGIIYFVYDDTLGNNAGLQAVKQTGRSLLQATPIPCCSSPTRPVCGERQTAYIRRIVILKTLKAGHLRSTSTEKSIQTKVYQANVWHKNFPELLNVAAIVKTNLKTGQCAKVLLFSDDLALASGTLIAYYPLRLQIGFTTDSR